MRDLKYVNKPPVNPLALAVLHQEIPTRRNMIVSYAILVPEKEDFMLKIPHFTRALKVCFKLEFPWKPLLIGDLKRVVLFD